MNPGTVRVDRLLVDTNLLVLFAVGNVNQGRIESFKRTRQYTGRDFDLLQKLLDRSSVYTVAHVLAEVSNLTDLPGPERLRAREFLKEAISLFQEIGITSSHAANEQSYPDLGLVDAAIVTVAREHDCVVLTDDLDLYLRLQRQSVKVVNFTYVRARSYGF